MIIQGGDNQGLTAWAAEPGGQRNEGKVTKQTNGSYLIREDESLMRPMKETLQRARERGGRERRERRKRRRERRDRERRMS